MEQIWIPSKEYEWMLGEIESMDPDKKTFLVSVTNKSRLAALGPYVDPYAPEYLTNARPTTYKESQICRIDPTHLMDLDDLCDMKNLHEGPLLHILRRRFFSNRIYTYVGDILISINPYALIDGLYDNPLQFYQVKKEMRKGFRRHVKAVPHIYHIANAALKKLAYDDTTDGITHFTYQEKSKNQTVIISGESGAGNELI